MTRVLLGLAMATKNPHEKYHVCPYDPSHELAAERLPFHLVRCRNSIRQSDPKRFKHIQKTLAVCR